MTADTNNLVTHGLQRQEFTVAIHCPKCKQPGTVVWEENKAVSPEGPKPLLVSVSHGFYQRVRKDHSSLPQIVCHTCGTVQPD